MKFSSTYKLLFLLNLLSERDCTKKEIIEIFACENIKITKSLITHYINQFLRHGIEVKKRTNKKEHVYYLDKKEIKIILTPEQMSAISDVKKLLISQKKYENIKKIMHLFYRVSKFIKDKDTLEEFLDFGYYSTLNWALIGALEQHCREKNIIRLDYILPSGQNKYLDVHANDIKISDWSNRLYLKCVLDGAKTFSILPIDKIFMIKKVLKNNVEFNLKPDIITYVVSKEAFEQAPLDEKEILDKIEGNKAYIKRPIEDNFNLIQRLCYYCPDLYYISDLRIKNLLKEKLEMVKANYDSTV